MLSHVLCKHLESIMALLKPAQIPEVVPGVTIGAVRMDLWKRDENGLAQSGALVFRGRRILIDAEQYVAWMRKSSKQQRAA